MRRRSVSSALPAVLTFLSPPTVTSAQKIVYSTCSVHPEEDELVVLAALDSAECKAGGWALAERADVLPSWPRRGRKEVMGKRAHLADSLICCEPGTDKTNVRVSPRARSRIWI